MREPDAPYTDYGLRIGHVKNDIDPEKSGRVEVVVEGLIDGGAWAEVCMVGSPWNRGGYVIPVIGTQVIVGFLEGDLYQPVILGALAPPVLAGGVRAAVDKDDLPKLTFYENEDWLFILGKSGTLVPYAALYSRRSENRMGIIMDLDSNTIKITAPESVSVETEGTLQLISRILRFTVGGTERVVQPNGRPI